MVLPGVPKNAGRFASRDRRRRRGRLREAAWEASEALDHQLAGRLLQAAVDADGSFESRLALVAELPYLGEATRALGCVLWAAEAASTASLIHRAEGRLGSALASSARLNDLTPACEGARTPGLSSPPAILTRREHEVAGFASRGLSDREIAERLHLSVRTVHSHLYRIYRKLNIEHRSQLPDIISP